VTMSMQALLGQLLVGLINGSFYAMLSLGLAIIFGLLGIVNVAQGSFYMLGAFGSWMLLRWTGLGYWPAFVLTPIGVGLFGGVLIPIQGTVPIGAAEIGLIVFAACCLLCGYFLVVVAMQHGEVSVVTPFRYVFIPFSIVTGFVVWREVPDAITVLGIGIIIATGVYTFVRERRLALARARTAAPPAHPIAPAPAEPRA